MSPPRQYKPLDGGWGWVVVVAAFFSVFLLATCVTSFAILYEEFIISFGLSRLQGGWIGSVQLALAFINSIPTGVLVQQFGCRPVCICGFFIASVGLGASCWAVNYVMLFFTYGVVTGIGLGMAMLPIFVSVQLYFDKRRAIAVGLALCGINLSGFVTGPLIRLLVDTFGWRGASLLHAGAMLHGVIFASAFRPLSPITIPAVASADDNLPSKVGCCRSFLDLFDFALLKQKRFLLYILGNFLVNFSSMTFHQHLVSFGILQGVNKATAALLPTIMGVFSAVGRVVSGCCGDRKSVDRRFMCASFAMMAGAVVCFAFLGTDFISIAVISGLFAFCSGTFSTLQFTVLVDLVGVARIAQAQAFFSAFMGSSSLFSGPLSGIICIELLSFPYYPRMCWERYDDGFLVDRTGDYNLPFFINGLCHVAGGAIIFVVAHLHMVHVTSTSGMNGHVTGNGHVGDAVFYGKANGPEKVELIITTV